MRVRIFYVFLMVVFAFAGCRYKGGAKTRTVVAVEPNILAVEGFKLSKSLLVERVNSAGLTRGIREAWVVSETRGIIRDVNFSLGDRVRVGQVLLRVDDDLLQSNLRLNRQRLKTSRLEADAADINLKNGSISQVQYSQIRDRLLAAESAYDKAQDDLDNARLTAPIAGSIAAMDASVGVGNFLGSNIRVARIVDNSSLKTEITVGEGEVLKIREGDVAEIRGGDGFVRSGLVTAISAGGDSSGGFTVQVEWVPGEDDPILAGMSVDVSVELSRGEPVIIAPASAIIYRGDKAYAYVDSGGRVERREISTGLRLGERLEVPEGLDEGEIIITTGLGSLNHGMAVETTLIGESGDIL